MVQPAQIALTAVLIPAVALTGSYLISAAAGDVPWCMPLWEGCTSISLAARRGDAIFLFRGLMLPFTFLLAAYWYLAYRWLLLMGDQQSRRPQIMLGFGLVGALFLVVYVDFLGSSGRVYEVMRRVGVVNFFTFTAFAGLLLVSRLYAIKSSAIVARLGSIRRLKFGICLGQLTLALINLWVALGWEDRYAMNNIIEWNSALLLLLFGGATYVAWRRSNFSFSYAIF